MSSIDLYELLGIRRTASLPEIKAAYRMAAKKAHPDAGGDADHFVTLTRAYNVLSDPDMRKRYDETGAVDQETVDNLFTEMITILSGALDRVLSTSRLPVAQTDFVMEMRGLVGDSKADVASKLEEIVKRLAQLREVRQRIVRKDEAQNLFLTVIDGKISDIVAKEAAATRALKVLTRAVEELERYDSIVDIVRFVQSGIFASSPHRGESVSFFIEIVP